MSIRHPRGAPRLVVHASRALTACFCVVLPTVASAQTASRPTSEIVVTASPIAGDPDRFAAIVTRIERDEILKTGGASLADALRNVPGVAGTGFAPGASRSTIRGMDAFRVKILEDGVSASDVSEVGPDHGVPIDPLAARSIEVVRGAATLRWGSQAIGGVVNAINDRVPLTLPSRPISGDVTASYDDNAAVGSGSALVDARLGQFAFHADGFGRRASDYDTPDGEQTNTFFRGGGYAVGTSYFFGRDNQSRTGVGYVHYDSKYGIPADDAFIDLEQDKYITNSSFQLSAGPLRTVNLTGGYADYRHSEIDPETGEALSTFLNKETNVRLEGLLGALGPFANAAIGVDVSDRHFSALGEGEDFLLPARTRSGALYAFGESELGERVQIQAAARVEHVKVTGVPLSDQRVENDYTPVSASVGALWTVSDGVSLGLTASSAARAPGQVELFARGPHEGPRTYEIGDPNLDIERANALEATLRVKRGRFDFEGALWGARFSDYVYGEVTGALCDEEGDCSNGPDAELQELFFVQRDADFYGAEAKATVELARTAAGTLQAVALADYVRADLRSGGGPVPRIQPYRVGGGFDWESERFDAGVLAVHVGEQDRVPAGESVTDGYFNLDAQAAWRPFGADRGPELSVVGQNLTDTTQRNAVAFNRDFVVKPGRNVRFIVRQSF